MTSLLQTAPALADTFAPAPGYLNAATLGLPPRAVHAAVREALDAWQRGEACPTVYDGLVNRSRELYAQLVGVPTSWVSVGSQTSVTAGVVAASLPDGARVVCIEGDFSSMVFPFLAQAHRGVRVSQVPLEALPDAVRGCDVVAFSLAQSSDGRVADAEAVVETAAQVGAMTFCDTTQAAGWLDVDASRFDVTVCSAYKWLCAPRGAAFTTVRPEALGRITPVNAGWYAGESIWDSCYGPSMRLADDARRLDVSPAWLAWVGAVPALELFHGLPTGLARDHGARLADDLRARLDLAPERRPVVALDDADGALAARLADAGCRVAGRAGRVRIAFHLWNDEADVERAASALTC